MGANHVRVESSQRAPFAIRRYRRTTAPINRSHSPKLPRKPNSQAVSKLNRAFISWRFPPFVSLAFRYWRREMKMCEASGSCSASIPPSSNSTSLGKTCSVHPNATCLNRHHCRPAGIAVAGQFAGLEAIGLKSTAPTDLNPWENPVGAVGVDAYDLDLRSDFRTATKPSYLVLPIFVNAFRSSSPINSSKLQT